MSKAVVSLNTGLEDAETVRVAFLVAVGAAEQGRPTLMFLTKEAVRLASESSGGEPFDAAYNEGMRQSPVQALEAVSFRPGVSSRPALT